MSRGYVSEAVRPVRCLERYMVRLVTAFARVERHPMGGVDHVAGRPTLMGLCTEAVQEEAHCAGGRAMGRRSGQQRAHDRT